MAKNSNIEWTDHTFNGWRGCTKVSPGCANCYAEKLVTQRLNGEWGPGRPRQLASDAMWREPLKWNAEAAARIESLRPGMSRVDAPLTRPRVFCSSLADWLDDEVPVEWLARLMRLIAVTPHLDWLLLTKRPQNFRARLNAAYSAPGMGSGKPEMDWLWHWANGYGCVPANVWIGTSVEDQKRADERIPELLKIPARVRFLSCEPLLGPVSLGGTGFQIDMGRRLSDPVTTNIHWVIVGGESGPDARPMHPAWARSLRDQCAAAGVPFFFKQWGEWAPAELCFTNGCGPQFWRVWPDDAKSYRIGKKTAGRLLDGVEHNGFPTA